MNTIPHPLANLLCRPPKRRLFIEFVIGEAPFSNVEVHTGVCPVCDEECSAEYMVQFKGFKKHCSPANTQYEDRLWECLKCGAAMLGIEEEKFTEAEYEKMLDEPCYPWAGDRR